MELGTIRPIKKAATLVEKYKKEAPVKSPTQNKYAEWADKLD